MSDHPSYARVFLTFARNSLVRDMTFRANFIIECVISTTYVLLNLGFYILIFRYTPSIAEGWDQYRFFVFLATTLLINSLMQAFFMPNAEEFSEMIRLGKLDFALVKPIDTQFLISFHRVNWASLGNFVFGLVLLGYSLSKLDYWPSLVQMALYPLYLLCGVAILYSLMTTMAAISVWMGRNQNLYQFWFYVTNFSRYPMEIYRGTFGDPLRLVFTFVIPILIVVNVPARIMAQPLEPTWEATWLAVYAIFATLATLAASRYVFTRAIWSYRSASS